MTDTARVRLQAADIVFGAVLVLTCVFYVSETRHTYFFADEWLLADRGHSIGDLFRAYNGHLSVVYIGTFRVLFELFGLDQHLPFRLAGIASLVAVPAALHLCSRRRVGPGVAGMVAVLVLWFRGITLEAGALNHWLALASTVVLSAALLDQRRRADWVVFGALTFALCCAGGGVTAAAGAGVYVLCTRPHGRRWLAVLVPSAAWGVWYLVEGRGSAPVPEALKYGFGDTLQVAWDGVRASFEGLVLGNRWAGVVLMVAFAALLVRRLTGGLTRAANQLAWTAGLGVWWIGIISSRGALAQPDVFRYRYVGAVLIVLAALPSERVEAFFDVPKLASAVGVLVVALLLAGVNHDDVSDWADQQRIYGRATRELVLVASVRPPLRMELGGQVGTIGVDQYRRAIELYGAPQRATRKTVDRQLVAIAPRLVPAAGGARCRPAGGVLTPGPRVALVLRADDEPVVVEARRFGTRFVRVGTIGAGQRRQLQLPAVGSKKPWQVRAVGACVSGG